jgi:hypothetical protein
VDAELTARSLCKENMLATEKKEQTMTVELRKEHRWLQQLVGEWTMEAEMAGKPGEPAETSRGTETVRSLEGVWTVAEGRGEMPGGGIGFSIQTLGFDPARNQFVGTFIGSMMTHLWVYSGNLDASEKILTLDTEGPDFQTEGKLVRYQDVIEIKSPDHRVLKSRMLGDDGRWQEFLTANYRRRK